LEVDVYARVSTYTGTAEDFDRGQERVESELLPRIKGIRGYKGVLSLVDRTTGESLSITLWDTEDAMHESRDLAKQIRAQAAAFSSEEIVAVREYEVGFADLP
jgi:heme-degrading monooxygenase HmoA